MSSFEKTIIGNNIQKAAEWLISGHCVAIPTETVYGLAANALDTAAVAQIFEVKNRPTFDPLIVHLPNIEFVTKYTTDFPTPLRDVAERFWPGPLTILLPKKEMIPDLVTSGLPRVALRVPAHPLAHELLLELPFPLAAPSANPFGYISPTNAQHVADQLSGKIPYILDGGPCSIGLESTIVGWENEKIVVYRLGGMSIEEIENVAGSVEIMLNQSSNPAAPGMLKSHYAPRKPLYLNHLEENIERFKHQRIGLLTFQTSPRPTVAKVHIALSPNGSLKEAAQHLFAALRTLDNADIDLILAETMPDQGLGKAINDRLRRAAAPEND
jgi:L-threonylcarbamoyladenylate synthase